MLSKPLLLIALTFIVSLLVGFSSIGNILAFHGTFLFFPFFMIGFFLKRYNCIDRIRSGNKLIASVILIILLIVTYMWIPPFYVGSMYKVGTMIQDCGVRVVQLTFATVICFCILVVTPEKLGKITDVGQFTLLIYLLHPPFVKLLKGVSSMIGYSPDILISIVITAITVTLIYNLRRLKLFKYLT